MKLNLELENDAVSEEKQAIIKELKNCNIEWVTNDTNWPTLKISFAEKEKKQLLNYQVVMNNTTAFEGNLDLKDIKNPGQFVIFKAFGIDLE